MQVSIFYFILHSTFLWDQVPVCLLENAMQKKSHTEIIYSNFQTENVEEKYTTKSLTAHKKFFVFLLLLPTGLFHAHQDKELNGVQRTAQTQKKNQKTNSENKVYLY